MKEYTAWFIRQLHVIRVNVAIRIVAGIVQVALFSIFHHLEPSHLAHLL